MLSELRILIEGSICVIHSGNKVRSVNISSLVLLEDIPQDRDFTVATKKNRCRDICARVTKKIRVENNVGRQISGVPSARRHVVVIRR